MRVNLLYECLISKQLKWNFVNKIKLKLSITHLICFNTNTYLAFTLFCSRK